MYHNEQEPHLQDLLKDRIQCVLLHLGLPLATLGLIREQVHFDIPEWKKYTSNNNTVITRTGRLAEENNSNKNKTIE